MRNQYHPFAKFFHWAIVLVVVGQFIELEGIPNLHFSLGLLVLPLAVGLLVMRFVSPVAKLEGEISGLLLSAATVMRLALYTLMVVIPLAGWAAVNGFGMTVSFFGLFELPNIVAQGSQVGRLIGEVHSTLAGLIGFLAAGHATMALYHHFITGDVVLKRMLPKMLVK